MTENTRANETPYSRKPWQNAKVETTSQKDVSGGGELDETVTARIISDLQTCFLVEAVPGSGKTYNLVNRMAALVAAGSPVRDLAAITFSRKAAEELRGRFREAMEKWLREEKLTDTQRVNLSNGLQAIDDGYLGTIHSFCARLLRECPIEAELPPDFQEMEEDESRDLLSQAWLDYLAGRREFVQELSEREVNPRDEYFISALNAVGENPDLSFEKKWPELPPLETDALIQKVKEVLAKIFTNRPEYPDETFGETELKFWEKFSRIRNSLQLDAGSPERLSIVLNNWPSDHPTYNACNYREATTEAFNLSRAIKPELDAFLDNVGQRFYPILVKHFLAAAKHASDERLQQGKVNFFDLLFRTVRLLKSHPQIRRQLAQRYPHLLVDEFQDTDPLQAEMIFLLSAENAEENDWRLCRPRKGSLFIVGDPKQSIYRFRRADIAVYQEAKKILQSSDGEILTLRRNRRSLPGICRWLNKAFEEEFVRQKGEDQADYTDICPFRDSKMQSIPEVMALNVPEEIDRRSTTKINDWEAAAISTLIQKALKEGFPGVYDGKPVPPNEILLLARTNNLLVTFALALDSDGIPVSIVGGGSAMAAFLQLEFEPLYWLLRAVSDEADRPALFGALVGPFFGLEDHDLWEHARFTGGLWAGPDAPERGKVSRALDQIGRWRRLIRVTDPATAFSVICGDVGLQERLVRSQNGLLKRDFLEMMERLFREHSLFRGAVDELGQWILKWPKNDSSVPQDRVRLMTVHKAKGLEASVVFIVGISNKPSFPQSLCFNRQGATPEGHLQALVKWGRGTRLIAVSPEWSEHMVVEEKAKEAEETRVAYVAATRAKDLLIISRALDKSRKNARNPLGKSYSPSIRDLPEIEIPERTEKKAAKFNESEVSLKRVDDLEEADRTWKENAGKLENAFGSVTRLVCGDPPRDLFDSDSDGGIAFGSAVHTMFEWAIRSPDFSVTDLLKLALAQDPDLAAQKDDLEKIMKQVMNSEFWKEASKSPEIFTEVPVSMPMPAKEFPGQVADGIKSVLVDGTIDLIYRHNGGWKLVDYKTDFVRDDDHLQRLTDWHAKQITVYAQIWEKLTNQKVIEKSLLFVRKSKMVPVE